MHDGILYACNQFSSPPPLNSHSEKTCSGIFTIKQLHIIAEIEPLDYSDESPTTVPQYIGRQL
jgi:hypothetical protein